MCVCVCVCRAGARGGGGRSGYTKTPCYAVTASTILRDEGHRRETCSCFFHEQLVSFMSNFASLTIPLHKISCSAQPC